MTQNKLRQFFVASDGTRLCYRFVSNPGKPVLLFCYGLVCSEHHFKYQWDYLSENYQLLVLDYRGHYPSEDPKVLVTLNFSQIADDLYELFSHLNIKEPVSMIGHSMGVNIALEFYEKYQSLVKNFILISGSATFPLKKNLSIKSFLFGQSIAKVFDGVFPVWVDELWKMQTKLPGSHKMAAWMGFNKKLSAKKDIQKVVQVISGFSPKVFIQLLGEMLHCDQSEIIEEIKVPTLVIAGEKDRMVPLSLSRLLHQQIKESDYHVVKKGSHCPQLDRPEEVSLVIEHFLLKNEKARALETLDVKKSHHRTLDNLALS